MFIIGFVEAEAFSWYFWMSVGCFAGLLYCMTVFLDCNFGLFALFWLLLRLRLLVLA